MVASGTATDVICSSGQRPESNSGRRSWTEMFEQIVATARDFEKTAGEFLPFGNVH
jgi:hypothetical protein